ncbi:regakine-1-like [Neoarius graeffei]|uniref:regakine-1-like n=1 Tax=Neoarius graeffei TaxID=443677 RepID=UPI00298D5D59|nr:regakine-1-like [Neoarius graeffei]
MKMGHVFLVLGLILNLALYSDAQLEALQPISQSESCCFKFFTGRIPPKKIQKVKKTGSHCPQQGFIVTTPEYASLCVHKVTGKA